MGLEDFSTEDGESSSSDNMDGKSTNTRTQYGSIDDTDLDLVRQHAEGDEHFNTKSRIAIQLHNTGWDVSVEGKVNLATGEYIQADVAAFDGPDGDVELNISDVDSMIVEVGSYDQPRAKKALDVVDVVLWVGKGESLNDAVIIQHLMPEKTQNEFESLYEYRNSDGDKIEPELDGIYVERYKVIAKEILSTFNQITGPSQVVSHINANTDHEINYEEAEKILSAMGF